MVLDFIFDLVSVVKAIKNYLLRFCKKIFFEDFSSTVPIVFSTYLHQNISVLKIFFINKFRIESSTNAENFIKKRRSLLYTMVET